MPSTFVHGFLPTSCAIVSHRKNNFTKKEWVYFFFICFFLGNCPDLDIVPALFFPSHWDELHRNVGHNVFSLTLLIAFGTLLLKRFFYHHFSTRKCFVMAFLLVGSHILLDASGDYQKNALRVGVPVFWPVSNYEFKLPFSLFVNYKLNREAGHPILGHLLSIEFWKVAVWNEIISSLGLFFLWVSTYYFGKMIFALVKRQPVATLPREVPIPVNESEEPPRSTGTR